MSTRPLKWVFSLLQFLDIIQMLMNNGRTIGGSSTGWLHMLVLTRQLLLCVTDNETCIMRAASAFYVFSECLQGNCNAVI
jgi:hypothetical protein